jgi:hypothetical protein
MSKDIKTIEQELKAEMPFRWKVQAVSKYKPTATCVAYIDARDAMNRLDEVLGIDGWRDEYTIINSNLFCTVYIKVENEWIGKSDCGVESMMEKEKGQSSDAFKRACVKWGIGRFLYSKDVEYVTTNEQKSGSNHPYPVDDNGKRIFDLTKHINSRKGSGNRKPPSAKAKSEETPPEKTIREKRMIALKAKCDKLGVNLADKGDFIAESIKNCGCEHIEDLEEMQFEDLLSSLE